MSTSISSASVSSMKASTSGEIHGVKHTPLGCHILPSVASPTCCRVQAEAKSQGVWSPSFGHLSRNCPMFSTVVVGGHRGIVDTLAICLHMTMRHLVSSLAAVLPPSVSGRRSSHHVMSSSPRFPSLVSSHLVVCHMRSRHFFIGEHRIIMHLLDSWNEFSSSVSSSKSSNVACVPPMEWEEAA